MCGYIDISSGNLRIMALLSLLQYSRNVSQTRWIIDDERMGEASVEVIPCPSATVVVILHEGHLLWNNY